jgi:Flp pilus assembly pilin Flp
MPCSLSAAEGFGPSQRPRRYLGMVDRLRRFIGDDDGLTSVEYALLLALLFVASLSAWQALGGSVPMGKVNTVANILQP